MRQIAATVDGLSISYMDAQGRRTPAVVGVTSMGEAFLCPGELFPHIRECEVCGDLYDGRAECAICVEAMRAEAVRQALMDGDGALCSPI